MATTAEIMADSRLTKDALLFLKDQYPHKECKVPNVMNGDVCLVTNVRASIWRKVVRKVDTVKLGQKTYRYVKRGDSLIREDFMTWLGSNVDSFIREDGTYGTTVWADAEAPAEQTMLEIEHDARKWVRKIQQEIPSFPTCLEGGYMYGCGLKRLRLGIDDMKANMINDAHNGVYAVNDRIIISLGDAILSSHEHRPNGAIEEYRKVIAYALMAIQFIQKKCNESPDGKEHLNERPMKHE